MYDHDREQRSAVYDHDQEQRSAVDEIVVALLEDWTVDLVLPSWIDEWLR